MTMTLYNKGRFPYESVLRTGCLGGRGRLGEAAAGGARGLACGGAPRAGREAVAAPATGGVACRLRACGRRPRTSEGRRGAASRLGGDDTLSLSQRRMGRAQEARLASSLLHANDVRLSRPCG